MAVLLAWLLTPDFDRSLGLGTAGLTSSFTTGQGFVAEYFGSTVFYLIIAWLVCLRIHYLERKQHENKPLPFFLTPNIVLPIGLFFTAVSIPTVFVTGASFNWFRHFWPAVISGTIDSTWWLYFVGPLVAIFTVWLIMWGYLKWIGMNYGGGGKTNGGGGNGNGGSGMV